jgi:hypothetical protein
LTISTPFGKYAFMLVSKSGISCLEVSEGIWRVRFMSRLARLCGCCVSEWDEDEVLERGVGEGDLGEEVRGGEGKRVESRGRKEGMVPE